MYRSLLKLKSVLKLRIIAFSLGIFLLTSVATSYAVTFTEEGHIDWCVEYQKCLSEGKGSCTTFKEWCQEQGVVPPEPGPIPTILDFDYCPVLFLFWL